MANERQPIRRASPTLDAEPEVVSCYFDPGFEPALAAMRLVWPQADEHRWQLPRGVVLQSPPPGKFGLRLQRLAADAYDVCLVWDDFCLRWSALDADELHNTDLPCVLRALKTNLDYLLEQPVEAVMLASRGWKPPEEHTATDRSLRGLTPPARQTREHARSDHQ